jgi:hypothetical protein
VRYLVPQDKEDPSLKLSGKIEQTNSGATIESFLLEYMWLFPLSPCTMLKKGPPFDGTIQIEQEMPDGALHPSTLYRGEGARKTHY